jgi:hypothetical protein
LSSFDAELQRVIAAWDGLPVPIRKAIGVLTEQTNGRETESARVSVCCFAIPELSVAFDPKGVAYSPQLF